MSIIKHLSLHEAHKIAAGEVIERPAHIIKELIENALDAGATHISIYIEDGGKRLIRIVDNGCGMDETDAQICFDKHATSKIYCIDELERINTFGFRGEALASIAAVSRVALITKQADTLSGIKVSVACSKVIEVESVSAITGTDIRIADLFYTIPARKKFLKKQETEWRQIVHLFHAFCLAFPGVHFTLYNHDALIYNCPPTTDTIQRCAQLWQHQRMLSISSDNSDQRFSIAGALGMGHYRYDRNSLFFFVNKRWVKHYTLVNAVIKGHQGMIPPERYPVGVLSLTIDPELVDINIHPRKEEVAFLHPNQVTQYVTAIVKQALEKNTSDHVRSMAHKEEDVQIIVRNNLHVPLTNLATMPSPAFYSNTEFKPFDFDMFLKKPAQQTFEATRAIEPVLLGDKAIDSVVINDPDLVQNGAISGDYQQETASEYSGTIIGQLHKTYILVEQYDGLFLVDQHAAHERILYECFATKFDNFVSVNLLFPQIITLSMSDFEAVVAYLSLLTNSGIGIEPFGMHELRIISLPAHVKHINVEELIKQLVGWIHEYDAIDHQAFTKILHEKLHAQLACKAAVKAGDILTHEQMHALLQDLYKTPNRFACPHGRPTGFLLSFDEIEKKCKRKK